ncbi:hypothetical protein OH76DRAFT_146108 [Lentinus brumalis]|uniref:Uncharacterized protein n=1 Tax=Lentinus brumalis TaxID=2498619 RepID=A0A371CP57_9APHY|nr:hypothetical protein OH76DRAFT_146108 [Polyporus brumalis]
MLDVRCGVLWTTSISELRKARAAGDAPEEGKNHIAGGAATRGSVGQSLSERETGRRRSLPATKFSGRYKTSESSHALPRASVPPPPLLHLCPDHTYHRASQCPLPDNSDSCIRTICARHGGFAELQPVSMPLSVTTGADLICSRNTPWHIQLTQGLATRGSDDVAASRSRLPSFQQRPAPVTQYKCMHKATSSFDKTRATPVTLPTASLYCHCVPSIHHVGHRNENVWHPFAFRRGPSGLSWRCGHDTIAMGRFSSATWA